MPLSKRSIVAVGRKCLRRDVDGAFRFAVILEESRDRHDAKVILALTERRPFFREHADDCVSVATDSDHFANRRFMRKQTLLDHLSDDDYAARKIDIFVV